MHKRNKSLIRYLTGEPRNLEPKRRRQEIPQNLEGVARRDSRHDFPETKCSEDPEQLEVLRRSRTTSGSRDPGDLRNIGGEGYDTEFAYAK